MMVGSSNRLTNINRMASPKTETHDHHQAPRAGTVNDTNAIVVATAIAGRTSTANAHARICQGAKAFSDDTWVAVV